ncbi:MAG: hypothetical protein AABX29_06505 [Nanoarchaeota archaeon]
MVNDEVKFLRLEPEKNGVRDRSKGRQYLLEALVHNTRGTYKITVNQAVGGIDENGNVLFDPQVENTGGQIPDIAHIEKIGGHLFNGEGRSIQHEWNRQYFSDPEILRSLEEFGDEDLIRVYKNARTQYSL